MNLLVDVAAIRMLRRQFSSRLCLPILRLYPLYHSYRQYARPSRAKFSAAKDTLLDTLSTRFPEAYLQKVVDKMPDVKPLDFKAGPMVWIDLEMTGLVPGKDKILEIAVGAKSSRHAERD